MSHAPASSKPEKLLSEVLAFVHDSAGLSSLVGDDGRVVIRQSADSKTFAFDANVLEEVLQRSDSEGKSFIQINFSSGLKILLTEALIGFKPSSVVGLDMNKIPKVVTTPDLISVFEAIEEGMGSDSVSDHELEILKLVYHAILMGGLHAGFDLSVEKRWLTCLVPTKFRASA